MRFERRYEGIHYAITLRPSDDGKILKELRIEVYRKYPSGERRGFTWKVSFLDRELRIRRYEYSDLSWHKAEVTIKASWIAEWYIEDAEKTVRDLGVKGAAEHFLEHLRLICDHPLAIPLRL